MQNPRVSSWVIRISSHDNAASEICAKPVTRAEFPDAEGQPRDLLASWSARYCTCTGNCAFALPSDRRFYRNIATARDELGCLGSRLLPATFCRLQYPSASRWHSRCRRRFLFWVVVGIFYRAGG